MTAVLEERSADTTEAERRLAAMEARRAARARGLSQLMRERPDLAGTYAPADLALEALSWSI